MKHKEAQVAHLRACMDMLESGWPADKQVSVALQTRDEEAALMNKSSVCFKIWESQPIATITNTDIEAAQKAWGDALINISKTYENEGLAAAKALGETIIDTMYGYNYGPVLFKPTVPSKEPFRTTKRGAMAYFVGGDSAYPKDKGFAIKGWRQVTFENHAIWKEGNLGIAQGNVILTDKNGAHTTVDKTFGFWKTPNGNVVIVLHHSSLPFKPSRSGVPFKPSFVAFLSVMIVFTTHR